MPHLLKMMTQTTTTRVLWARRYGQIARRNVRYARRLLGCITVRRSTMKVINVNTSANVNAPIINIIPSWYVGKLPLAK